MLRRDHVTEKHNQSSGSIVLCGEVPTTASCAPPETALPLSNIGDVARVLPSKPIVTVSFVRTPSLSMARRMAGIGFGAETATKKQQETQHEAHHDTAVFSCPAKG